MVPGTGKPEGRPWARDWLRAGMRPSRRDPLDDAAGDAPAPAVVELGGGGVGVPDQVLDLLDGTFWESRAVTTMTRKE